MKTKMGSKKISHRREVKNLKRIIAICVFAIGLMVFQQTGALAVPLTNTSVNIEDFDSIFDLYYEYPNDTIVSPFDSVFSDGDVFSQVWWNEESDLYAYTYRIDINSSIAFPMISVPFGSVSAVDIGENEGITSFYLNDNPGTIAPSSSELWESSNPELLNFYFTSLSSGTSSYWFGAVSGEDPGVTIASLLGDTVSVYTPIVENESLIAPPESFTPVPEPSTLMLLGSGLIGLGAFRRKFSKK